MNSERVQLLFRYVDELKNHIDSKKIKVVVSEIEKELGIVVRDVNKDPNKALVIMIQDTTGSMGIWEKQMSRDYFVLAQNEIKNKYASVDTKYIGFSTKAEEYSTLEDTQRNNDGGTIVSSGLKAAHNIILQNLDKNIYVFLFSDGDNLTSDNAKCTKLLEEMLEDVNHLQYVEANQYGRTSTLASVFKHIRGKKKFDGHVIKTKNDALVGIKFREVLEGEGK